MRFSTLLAAIAHCLLASAGLAAEHTQDSLTTVQQNLAEKKALLVDVREVKEWDKAHLAQAQLMPLSQLKKAATDPAVLAQVKSKLPKGHIVYCHCAKGVRAVMAGNLLEKLGYDVRPLSAGFEDLLAAGFAAAKP